MNCLILTIFHQPLKNFKHRFDDHFSLSYHDMMKIISVVFFMLLMSPISARENYTLKDLESLIRQENDEEFFDHIYDIRPSQRGETWQSLVKKGSDLTSARLLSLEKINPSDLSKLQKLQKISIIRDDDLFHARLIDILKKYFSDCSSKKSSRCHSEAYQFWIQTKQSPEMAGLIFDLIDKNKLTPKEQWGIISKFTTNSASEFLCQRPNVLESIWEKITLDLLLLKKDYLLYFDQNFHPQCQKIILMESSKRLLEPKSKSDREISYLVLKSLMKISETQKDFFYLAYLLDNPPRGDLFNYAWNNMIDLKKDAKRRENALSLFRNLSSFPDEIITSVDQKKSKTILVQMKENFPELLSLYGRLCLDYYLGKKQFPDGNPTANCSKLIESPYALDVLGDHVMLEIKNAKLLK